MPTIADVGKLAGNLGGDARGVDGQVVQHVQPGGAVGHEADAFADGDGLGRARRVERGDHFIGGRGIGQIEQSDLGTELQAAGVPGPGRCCSP